MKPNPGDAVRIECADEIIEGILMPAKQGSKTVFVKLKNGYNIGVDPGRIKSMTIVKTAERHERKEKTDSGGVKKNPKLPDITILHTGGTIASKVDYRTGGVVTSFSPEELIALFPELKGIANIDSELVSNMWSDDLRFRHFGMMAEAVQRHVKKGADGIIIGIGTDNLAVAAAALSFILEKINIPVILVGAQRSSDRGSSDAGVNLVCAAEFIAKTDFAGVAICMHNHSGDDGCIMLPACKTRKMHTSRRDAFKPVNDKAIALVDPETRKISFLKREYQKRDSSPKEIVVKPKMEEKVGLLKVHVNMFPEQFSFFKGYKGLVIEGTGLGHTPGHVANKESEIHSKIFPAIKGLTDSGCVVVMTSQCIHGRVNMRLYSKGRDLLDLGVVSGEDMLAETALVKLSWLLGNYSAEEAKSTIGKNLRGEVTERTGQDLYEDEEC